MRNPQPKTVKVECDTCGLDWKQHKPDAKGVVRAGECVRLLKAELARARRPYSYVATTSGVNAATGAFTATNPVV